MATNDSNPTGGVARLTPWLDDAKRPASAGVHARRDHGVDLESGADLIEECPDC